MPAQVSVDLAAGYTVAPAGTPLGIASMTSSSSQGGGVGFFSGPLAADDPVKYAADPAALACAPGPYLAVWKLSTTALGLTYTMPVFIEHLAGDVTRVELRFCPPPLADSEGKPVTTTRVPLSAASFLLSGLQAPSTRGRYVSSAYITPAESSGAPEQASTVEARALQPFPHSITLKGRYDVKTRTAVLTGRVIQVGKPQARAAVEVVDIDSLLEPRQVRTTARGTFAARFRIGGATTFLARVDDATGPCGGTSTATAGCSSLTVTGTNTASVTVKVSR